MTSIERHRSTHHLLSDGHTDSLHHKPSPSSPSTSSYTTSTKKRRIPPAVPSPPRIASPTADHLQDDTLQVRKDEMDDSESDQWFFTEAELASTPSILDGVLPVDERCRRAKGVNFIIQAGIMLKLPQLTLATASVFFHRYFMRVSMVPEKGGQHHYNIAASALFLATKTEENCRKTKEIVIAVAKVAQKNPNLLIDEQSKEYWKWLDNLLTFEEHMLEMLTFDVVIEPPYTCLWRFLHQLQLEDSKAIRNAAWAFINDSCLTPLCLLITPQDIAIAAIYFAAKSTKEPIEDDENGKPWWEQLDGTISNIARGLNVLNDFWTENPLNRNDNPWTMSPMNDENDRDKTRKARREEHSPSPMERSQSHQSQNGYSQTNGTTNGTKSANVSPVKPHDIPAPTTESDHPPTAELIIPRIEEPIGSSDTALKEAANDPATHEHTSTENGLAGELVPVATADATTPKRKRDENAEEPLAKRVKAEESLEEEGEIDA